jgi:hypothetical protein
MTLKTKIRNREHVVEALEGVEDEELNPTPSMVKVGDFDFEVRSVPAKAWFPISAVATSVTNVILSIVEERERQKQNEAIRLCDVGDQVAAENLLKSETKWGIEDLLPYASSIAEAIGPALIRVVAYWLKPQIMEKVFSQTTTLKLFKQSSEQTDIQVYEWVEEHIEMDQLIDTTSEIIRVGNIDRIVKNWGAMAERFQKKFPNLVKTQTEAEIEPALFVLPSLVALQEAGPTSEKEILGE